MNFSISGINHFYASNKFYAAVSAQGGINRIHIISFSASQKLNVTPE